jgi:hypothetical protein
MSKRTDASSAVIVDYNFDPVKDSFDNASVFALTHAQRSAAMH